MASLVFATNGDLNEEEALQRALRESEALHVAEKQIKNDAAVAKMLFTILNGHNTLYYTQRKNEKQEKQMQSDAEA